MSSVPPSDGARHLHSAVQHVHHQSAPVPPPIPVHVATSQLVPEACSTSVQFASVGPPPLLHIHHVLPSTPSVPASSVVAVDEFSSSASGSSTYGGDSAAYGGGLGVAVPTATRRMREFIPEAKKDDEYWMKRQKNNDAAKRSREKRRANDVVMMRRIHELASENKRLKLELDVLRRQLGIVPAPHSEHAHAQSTRSALHQLPTGDVMMTARPKLEPVVSDYGVTHAYQPTGSVPVLDLQQQQQQQQRVDEVRHLHHHQHERNAAAYHENVRRPSSDWPAAAACSSNVSFTTSSSGPSSAVLAYRQSSSGNTLYDVAATVRPDLPCSDGGGQAPDTWPTYRSSEHPSSSCVDRLSDLTPIVIFSDVSSSSKDSVDDDPLHVRHVDTLTLRSSVPAGQDNGASRVDLESPLNLSTPSRQQSPVILQHVYSAEDTRRRLSIDFAHVPTGAWFPVTSNSESSLLRPVIADRLSQQRGDVQVTVPATVYEAQTPGAQYSVSSSAQWLPESVDEPSHRDLSSRSTSLSSVASVHWHSGLDAAPVPQSATAGVDDLVLVRGQQSTVACSDQSPTASRLVQRCGLPLKVRRKLTCSSTSWTSVDDPPPSNDCPVAAGFISGTGRHASDDGVRRLSSDTTQLSPGDWLQRSRPIEVSNCSERLDAGNGRSQ